MRQYTDDRFFHGVTRSFVNLYIVYNPFAFLSSGMFFHDGIIPISNNNPSESVINLHKYTRIIVKNIDILYDLLYNKLDIVNLDYYAFFSKQNDL